MRGCYNKEDCKQGKILGRRKIGMESEEVKSDEMESLHHGMTGKRGNNKHQGNRDSTKRDPRKTDMRKSSENYEAYVNQERVRCASKKKKQQGANK